MDLPEILVFALIAITFLYLAWVLTRGRERAAGKAKTRRDRLERTVDPARGGGPPAEEVETGRDRRGF